MGTRIWSAGVLAALWACGDPPTSSGEAGDGSTTPVCDGDVCMLYQGYGGANGDGSWLIGYDPAVDCTAAVVWFHGGMFPLAPEDLTHTRQSPLHDKDHLRAALGTIGDVMGGVDFIGRGGRVAVLGAVNRVAWSDTRQAWSSLIAQLTKEMGCRVIATAAGSSGAWAAIEMAATHDEVVGAVVSNAAGNFPMLRAIYDSYLRDWDPEAPIHDPSDPASDAQCTPYIQDLTATCEESQWCDRREMCGTLRHITGWIAENYTIFESSTSGVLPQATRSQFSTTDPYQREVLGVFPTDLDPAEQEGRNREVDLTGPCPSRHSLVKCSEGRESLRQMLVELLEG